MAGLAMTQYLDWVANTGPVFLSGEDNIINNVSRRSFVMGHFLRGGPASTTVQGGNKIQETLYLAASRTYRSFKRNETINWTNPQKDVVAQIDWRFALDWMTWDEAEYMLQTNGLSGTGLKTKYKDMAYSKQQRTWESAIDGYETKLWQPPNGATMFAEMEGSTGGEMYSIPVFVNENAGTSTGSFDANWTTVHQLSWASYGSSGSLSTNWSCYRGTYDATDPNDSDDSGNGLFDGFDDVSISIGYERPGFKDEYFEPDNAYTGGKEKKVNSTIICCSKKGKKQIMRLNRQSNNNLITPEDAAYPMPRWNGIAIKDVSALDSTALYAGSSSTYVGETASTVTKSGPRYYFLNCKYLKAIFHSEKYFQMAKKPKEPTDKVGVYITPVEVWGNTVCTGPRYQGLLSPA